MKSVLFFVLLMLILSCSHKTVKEREEIVYEEVKEILPDYRDDMIAVYNKLVSSIKKRNLSSILECYSGDAVYYYSETDFPELRCHDGGFSTSGIDNVEKHYQNMFRRRYLDSIEYEIITADNEKMQLKIINLWANSDFGVFEYLDFIEQNGKLFIAKHGVVRERKGVRG